MDFEAGDSIGTSDLALALWHQGAMQGNPLAQAS